GVETAVPGAVTAVDAGLVRVQVATVGLTALLTDPATAPPGVGSEVLVCIRAEDVALELPDRSRPTSPRNHLPATVTAVTVDGALVRVDLDAGFGLTAYITRPALAELGLVPGTPVVAAVKGPAVHLISRGPATPGPPA
ncbi:TOBE domain-containing protein, partial [Georgenia sp. 10Sc9-8]|nr:TOBE domain-containing protein [Georgenia halotolerans]